jgi:hypothetical protein
MSKQKAVIWCSVPQFEWRDSAEIRTKSQIKFGEVTACTNLFSIFGSGMMELYLYAEYTALRYVYN